MPPSPQEISIVSWFLNSDGSPYWPAVSAATAALLALGALFGWIGSQRRRDAERLEAKVKPYKELSKQLIGYRKMIDQLVSRRYDAIKEKYKNNGDMPTWFSRTDELEVVRQLDQQYHALDVELFSLEYGSPKTIRSFLDDARLLVDAINKADNCDVYYMLHHIHEPYQRLLKKEETAMRDLTFVIVDMRHPNWMQTILTGERKTYFEV